MKELEKLPKMYPDVEWLISLPSEDVIEAFGKGIMLKGTKNNRSEDFFIPDVVKDKLMWADVIVQKLNDTIVE